MRLGPLPAAKPLRLTITISVELKAALDDYARLHADLHGQAVTPETLIPVMLQTFMVNDRGFQQARRDRK
ncbi:MAG: DUF2274 domain-containing protein [Gammaproteobacteria bacterium]|nr:DUF2274 domain-containing protein [Gammaproteobacteria bacterium]